MRSLEAEWQSLTKNLTKNQTSDGRRCFYLGALLVISDILKTRSTMSPEYIFTREAEIRRALEFHVVPSPEPEKGA
jgi:hypothetical protein